MDDAIGMTPGYDGWKKTSLMKNIKPCLLKDGVVNYYIQKDNYTLKEDGNPSILTGTDGDVMVEIPLMGYKMWKDDIYQYVSVTTDPNREKDGYCYYAHSLDNEKDCDKIYMGAYLGYKDTDNKLYSRSDVSPANDINLIDFRTYATNKGKGYSLTSFFPRTLLQCLYVIIYKNLNSQSALGQGYNTNGSSNIKRNTGGTNSNTFCYGTTSGTQQIKLFGIEDFYGNLFQWLDGLYCDSSYNIKTDYRNSVFTGSNGNNFQFSTEGNNISGDNISEIQGTNTTGFTIKEIGGSYNTDYYCDYGQLYYDCFGVSSKYWADNSSAGVFQLDVYYAASDASSSNGARLMFKHQRPESAPPIKRTLTLYDQEETGRLARIFTKDFSVGETVKIDASSNNPLELKSSSSKAGPVQSLYGDSEDFVRESRTSFVGIMPDRNIAVVICGDDGYGISPYDDFTVYSDGSTLHNNYMSFMQNDTITRLDNGTIVNYEILNPQTNHLVSTGKLIVGEPSILRIPKNDTIQFDMNGNTFKQGLKITFNSPTEEILVPEIDANSRNGFYIRYGNPDTYQSTYPESGKPTEDDYWTYSRSFMTTDSNILSYNTSKFCTFISDCFRDKNALRDTKRIALPLVKNK